MILKAEPLHIIEKIDIDTVPTAIPFARVSGFISSSDRITTNNVPGPIANEKFIRRNPKATMYSLPIMLKTNAVDIRKYDIHTPVKPPKNKYLRENKCIMHRTKKVRRKAQK
mmetsp:Transcript_20132/g.24460  ORF Transcript_20132/g.24460 Transcript_20132/m.24460 type:complete len:112 (-) Transcript_20132:203-538(-)